MNKIDNIYFYYWSELIGHSIVAIKPQKVIVFDDNRSLIIDDENIVWNEVGNPLKDDEKEDAAS